jgi:hypothetical protein
MVKEKKLHIGTLDSIKGFKNISLDLDTYKNIYDLSQSNPMGVDLSVAKTIKFLFNYYLRTETNKTQIHTLKKELDNAKISKAQKVVKL